MPPPSDVEIKRLIARLGREPGIVEELLKEPDEKKRKDVLVAKGVLKREHTPNRNQILKEMLKLAAPETGGNPPPPPPGARPVEWVGAIATAAAGAAAAVCAGD